MPSALTHPVLPGFPRSCAHQDFSVGGRCPGESCPGALGYSLYLDSLSSEQNLGLLHSSGWVTRSRCVNGCPAAQAILGCQGMEEKPFHWDKVDSEAAERNWDQDGRCVLGPRRGGQPWAEPCSCCFPQEPAASKSLSPRWGVEKARGGPPSSPSLVLPHSRPLFYFFSFRSS